MCILIERVQSGRNIYEIPVFAGFPATRQVDRRGTEESIFKRSSTFLSNLAHSANKFRERKLSGNYPEERTLCPNNHCTEKSCSAKHPTLRGYFSILSRVANDLDPFEHSSGVQTLPVERRKKGGARVKKSVSFSSDTSFEEKREPYKRAAIHEAKVYHKGVLQGTRLSLPSLRLIRFISLEFVCIRPVRTFRFSNLSNPNVADTFKVRSSFVVTIAFFFGNSSKRTRTHARYTE